MKFIKNLCIIATYSSCKAKAIPNLLIKDTPDKQFTFQEQSMPGIVSTIRLSSG